MPNKINSTRSAFVHPEQPQPMMEPTSIEQVDGQLARLADRASLWRNVEIADRLTLLNQCIQGVLTVAEPWANACCQAKGIDPQAALAGEEWLVGPVSTVMALRGLITTLNAQAQLPPVRTEVRNGQTVVEVFPATVWDRLLWLGYRGEVWLEPGQPATQGQIYREPGEPKSVGQVCLVLGAGNISAIAATDVLNQLFAEDQVVLLKLNPVNDYLGPLLTDAFAPLVAAGFLQIAYGGAELGRYLCQHDQVQTIHITGSQATHDAIVWGADPAGRKATGQPAIHKPITSELGGVTPILVVPGPWTAGDMQFQARQVAAMVVHNASFNCVAGQVLVVARDWGGRSAFLTAVRLQLAAIPRRRAYYPGAIERYQAFLDRYPQALICGDGPEAGEIPWTVIPDVGTGPDEYALTTEAFCGILAEVNLPGGDDPAAFLAQAVTFANERIAGNLACAVLVKPASGLREPVEAAIAGLAYGAIGINVWPGVAFTIPALSWGAFPGNGLEDIQSGRGMVHNSYLYDHPQKSVLRAPFRIWPTPMWFADHRNLRRLAVAALAQQADPGWARLGRLVVEALKG
jgi:acyl-CoA reductase-like NAD-dependent aldehyde dehydrogenase